MTLGHETRQQGDIRRMKASDHIENIGRLAERIGRDIRIMEVCGTHTMTAFRSGMRTMLPDNIRLLSGPGCPVCVTPVAFIDRAVILSRQPGVRMATFGDLMRVPGTDSSLERERAGGALISVAYSPRDALKEAARRPDEKLIFLGVGFETTAPAVAWTIMKAAAEEIRNFSVLSAHKTMPRAMAALLAGRDAGIDGFLCPGHVSAIIGTNPYRFIPAEHGLPCVVTGFEAMDMIKAIEMILMQLAEGRAEVENEYTRGAGEDGNGKALALIREVFEECDAEWRGLGAIPLSGLRIRNRFRAHDAATLFPEVGMPASRDDSLCICGDILRGFKTPPDCPIFGTRCTPAKPAGACMVSSEGTCAAYHKYWTGRRK